MGRKAEKHPLIGFKSPSKKTEKCLLMALPKYPPVSAAMTFFAFSKCR